VSNEAPDDRVDATLREFSGGQKLFGRYKLLKILGRGGMGVVWLARDEELEREVALKFLPDVIVHDRSLLSELKRETKRSLELTHKNIVRIHDFVFDQTTACISMEYVDGDTLANLRSEKDRKVFEPNDLSAWTAQLCDALDYAHNQARIVHRDLKPANLMVNQKSDLKVSDFGIARHLGDTMSRLTVEQGRSGTLVYMSPQQLDGERGTHLDDIYSLGATLYDLLTSKPPFYSGNIDRQVHERVAPSMTDRRKDLNIEPASVPPVWEETVAACLAKDSTKRPQSAAEVAHRLQLSSPKTRTLSPPPPKPGKGKALLGAGGTILLLVAIAGWYFGILKRHGKPVAAPTIQITPQVVAIPEKSIAVLPFENLSAEKDDAFFADGIQDDVLASLGKIKDLKVIARSSVMIYRGAAVAGKLREIGQALRVSHVLQGSVRRGTNRVVINVALIDTRNDNQIWSQHYDRTLSDMLSLQGELAVEIARELQATLTPSEKTVAETKPTKNAEAYLLYLRARERETGVDKGDKDYVAAEQLYAQAIVLDPTFALAHARRSILNTTLWQSSDGTDTSRKSKAREQAEEALRLLPTLGEAHLALAMYFYLGEGDPAGALKELALAENTSPNSGEVFRVRGACYRAEGRWRESIESYQRAQDLDPRNADIAVANARNYQLVRDWPAAAKALNHALEIEPNSGYIQLFLTAVEWNRGNANAFHIAFAKFPAGFKHMPSLIWDQAMIDRDFATAEKTVNEYKEGGEKTYCLALIALARGDITSAHRLFETLRPDYEAGVRDHPEDAEQRSELGLLYAYLGRKEDAIRECRLAVDLVPPSKDPFAAPLLASKLALVYARTGETDQAITLIEHLLTTPGAVITSKTLSSYSITLMDLRLRWEWDPLRSNPRFKKIIEGPEPKTVY
jgi:serine/threonine protein kinase/tetratricopeptide (TPR) repeat protein